MQTAAENMIQQLQEFMEGEITQQQGTAAQNAIDALEELLKTLPE